MCLQIREISTFGYELHSIMLPREQMKSWRKSTFYDSFKLPVRNAAVAAVAAVAVGCVAQAVVLHDDELLQLLQFPGSQ
jgi:hypothetical protein